MQERPSAVLALAGCLRLPSLSAQLEDACFAILKPAEYEWLA